MGNSLSYGILRFENAVHVYGAWIRMIQKGSQPVGAARTGAFRPVMHLHKNQYTKRAGVAGIRARALSLLELREYNFSKKLGLRLCTRSG